MAERDVERVPRLDHCESIRRDESIGGRQLTQGQEGFETIRAAGATGGDRR